MTESLHAFWIALAVLLAMQLDRTARPLTAIGFGIVWGAAGLTRPETTVLLAPLLLPALMARELHVARRLSNCAAAVFAKAAVMAPWVVRNYIVYGTFVLHVPLGGLGLFCATYPNPPRLFRHATVPPPPLIPFTPEYLEITGPFWDPGYRPDAPGRAGRVARDLVEGMPVPQPHPAILVVRNERDMLEVDRRLAAAALRNIKNHKLLQLYNMARHFYGLWGWPSAWWYSDDLPSAPRLVWRVAYLAFLVVFVFGVRAAWKLGELGRVPVSWLILVACHAGFFLVYNGEARYKVTSAIFFYMFGGVAVAAILPCRAGRVPNGGPCCGESDRGIQPAYRSNQVV
jgi:hypothetical protein